ncbi:hypothetical protein [Micromonospora sp. HK10]|uniref:hypothetical protein n=1 Tax=Micromonospora sp. HK10 TaxID=1538294 RepID=UPI000628BF56|nr:hypothetical protein [Micromonospora sp. HK10]KKK05832.1 hypothetical protein LQ51_11615 [Micromonospora sp. HK10]
MPPESTRRPGEAVHLDGAARAALGAAGPASTEGTYAADPTLYIYQASNGTGIAFVTRTINSTVVPFVTGANTLTPTTTPTFRPVTITQPNTN